jgi:hypothetical protein
VLRMPDRRVCALECELFPMITNKVELRMPSHESNSTVDFTLHFGRLMKAKKSWGMISLIIVSPTLIPFIIFYESLNRIRNAIVVLHFSRSSYHSYCV